MPRPLVDTVERLDVVEEVRTVALVRAVAEAPGDTDCALDVRVTVVPAESASAVVRVQERMEPSQVPMGGAWPSGRHCANRLLRETHS